MSYRVTAGAAAATTVSFNTGYIANDIIGVWATNVTAGTVPTVPAGWTSLTSVTANSTGAVFAWKKATSSSETSGTWTNATALNYGIWRGLNQTTPFSNAGGQTGTTSTISYSGIVTFGAAGTDGVLTMSLTSNQTAKAYSKPATNQFYFSDIGASTYEATMYDSGGALQSYSFNSKTLAATVNWLTKTIELVADTSATNVPLVQTLNITGAANPTNGTLINASTSGNLLVVGLVVGTSSAPGTSITDTKSNTFTKLFSINKGVAYVEFYYCFNITGGSSHQIHVNNPSSLGVNAIVREFKGVATSSALDVSTTGNGTVAAMDSGATGATANASELVIGVFGDDWGAALTYTPGSGYGDMVTATTGAAGDITMQNLMTTSTGTQDALNTASQAPSWVAGVIAFKMGGGPTVYTQSLTASMTPTGALIRSTSRNLSATVTINGNLSKSLSRTITAALTITGALNRMLSRTLTASVSSTGLLARLTGRNLTASATPTGSLNKTTARILTASTTPTGSLLKRLARLLTASGTPTGALTTSRLRMSTLTASMTPTGALSKTTNKNLAASTTPTGSLSKSIAKTFTASISITGSLPKRLARALASSVSFVGNLAKGSFHGMTFTASTTPTGSLTRQNNKGLAANASPTGNLNKQAARTLTANVNVTGSLTKRLSRAFAGSVSSIGNLLRRTNRTMTAGSTPTGTLTKGTQRNLSGSATPTGTLKKRTSKNIGGSGIPTGKLSRSVSRLFGGNFMPTGSLSKTISKTFTASVSVIGTFFKAIVTTFVNPSRPIILGARRAISLLASKAGIINLDNQKDGIKLKDNKPGPSAPDEDDNNVNLK